MKKQSRIEVNKPIPGGFIDYLDLEPEGILRIVGWSSNIDSIDSNSLVYLVTDLGSERYPDALYRLIRRDIPALDLFSGFMFEFIGGFEGSHSIELHVAGVSTKILEIDNLSLPHVPAYGSLLTQQTVLGRSQIYGSGPPVTIVSEEVVELARCFLPPPILDFGCGAGPLVAELRRKGIETYGIELGNSMLIQPESVLPEIRPWVTFYNGHCPLEFDDNSFESVVAVEVIEHIDKYQEVLGEIFRISRQYFLITVPDMTAIPLCHKQRVVPWHLLEKSHVNFFTPRSLLDQLTRFWERENIKLFRLHSFFVNGTWVPGNLAALCMKNK